VAGRLADGGEVGRHSGEHAERERRPAASLRRRSGKPRRASSARGCRRTATGRLSPHKKVDANVGIDLRRAGSRPSDRVVALVVAYDRTRHNISRCRT
jgi:hypothetical protein